MLQQHAAILNAPRSLWQLGTDIEVARHAPADTWLPTYIMQLPSAYEKERRDLQQRRRDSWRAFVRQDLSTHGAAVYRFLRGPVRRLPPTLCRENGTVTADFDEVDQCHRDAWSQIWRQHHGEEDAGRAAHFRQEFGAHVLHRPQQLAPITLSDVEDALPKVAQRLRRAQGADFWSPREFLAWRRRDYQRLAQFYNVVEETGVWPDALLRLLVTPRPKGEVDDNQTRDISVSPLLYAVWTYIRLLGQLAWQNSWLHESMHGFASGRSPDTVAFWLALHWESAMLHDRPAAWVTWDLRKAFPSLSWKVVDEVLALSGCSTRVAMPMMHFWRAAERRFKHPCGVGLGWFVTNGAVTGDGHSVWVLNLMMAAWARFEKANQPQSQPRAFADDSGCSCKFVRIQLLT